jgi:hypothetical protein
MILVKYLRFFKLSCDSRYCKIMIFRLVNTACATKRGDLKLLLAMFGGAR